MNEFLSKFEVGNNKKYEIKTIQDSKVYAKKINKYLSWL